MLLSHLRRRATLSGTLILMTGCAQDPGFVPTSPDDCILLCALVHSLTGEADPAPRPSVSTPVKKQEHRLKTRPSGSIHLVQRTTEKPSTAPQETEPVRKALDATPVAIQGQPGQSANDPMERPAPYLQLPGSAPIAEVTSHFLARETSTSR